MDIAGAAMPLQRIEIIDEPLAPRLNHIKDFRNTYVAHQEQTLLDPTLARTELKNWISGLAAIYRAHHGGKLNARN